MSTSPFGRRALEKHRRTGRPLVVLKLAQTLDGRIATRSGESRWITGHEARVQVHRWRSRVDCIGVGAGTVAADDPRLNVRHVTGSDPRPLVVDGRLRVSPQAQVFQGPRPILATSAAIATERLALFVEQGVEVWTFAAADHRIDLDQLAERAGQAGITSLLIEGGGQLAGAALDAGIVDEVLIFIAPRLLGAGIAAIDGVGAQRMDQSIVLKNPRLRRLGVDVLYTAEVEYPCSPD
ncbi:MAG: hypothetical protein GKR89_11260 [Candidatus Latescibacteria bacterium]|nr:hypothetical protein [Candidatus Latescibacterota bacterium]